MTGCTSSPSGRPIRSSRSASRTRRTRRSSGPWSFPGFSDYLHPYDASHIIGVGKESAWGGVKLALFDVADVGNPSLVDSVVLGSGGSDSEVLTDHHAFLFDREKNLLVLPVHIVDYGAAGPYGGRSSVWGGVYAFGVSPTRGFSLKGTVKHYEDVQWGYSPVKRALYIENTLYTMSPDKIVMSDLAHGLNRVNSVEFG